MYSTVWEGKFPSYWDLNQWFHLYNDELILIFKNDNKRVMEIVNLMGSGPSHFETSKWNSILGSMDDNIFLSRNDDARSHLQISSVTCYNVKNRTFVWFDKHSFLTEKYKIPTMNSVDFPYYYISNYSIDLINGTVNSTLNKNKQWRVSKNKTLSQENNYLICYDSNSNILWSKKLYFGNWFQISKGDKLFFLLPDNTLEILNAKNGNVEHHITLNELKRTTDCVGGLFDLRNDLSFNKTSIFDVLVENNTICWLNSKNQAVLYDIKKDEFQAFFDLPKKEDLYLAAINDKYIILYSIENYEVGKLYAVHRREN